MYNSSGLMQLTTFQLAVIFGAITTFATGVLLYVWKVNGDSLFDGVNGNENTISGDCKNIITKDYYS